eukprot:gene10238-3937_t
MAMTELGNLSTIVSDHRTVEAGEFVREHGFRMRNPFRKERADKGRK